VPRCCEALLLADRWQSRGHATPPYSHLAGGAGAGSGLRRPVFLGHVLGWRRWLSLLVVDDLQDKAGQLTRRRRRVFEQGRGLETMTSPVMKVVQDHQVRLVEPVVVASASNGKGLTLACRLEPVDRLRGLLRWGWGGDPQRIDRPRAAFLPSAQDPSRAVVVRTRDEWRWRSASFRPDAAYRR
jgi:hypothetical protein